MDWECLFHVGQYFKHKKHINFQFLSVPDIYFVFYLLNSKNKSPKIIMKTTNKQKTQKLHNANIFQYKLHVSQILTHGLSTVSRRTSWKGSLKRGNANLENSVLNVRQPRLEDSSDVIHSEEVKFIEKERK